MRFRALLETVSNRIKLSDLPYRLGVERIDWLLDSYDGSPLIRWSRDGVSLIPDLAWQQLIGDLTVRCRQDFVEVQSYARTENVQDFSSEELKKVRSVVHGYADDSPGSFYRSNKSLQAV